MVIALDAFKRQRRFVRFFRADSWNREFKQFVDIFEKRKRELRETMERLNLHVTINVASKYVLSTI
jgi:hypothetical protein